MVYGVHSRVFHHICADRAAFILLREGKTNIQLTDLQGEAMELLALTTVTILR